MQGTGDDSGLPALMDVDNMCAILTHLGGECTWSGDSLTVCTEGANRHEMPEKIARSCGLRFSCSAPCWRVLGMRCFPIPADAISATAR